MIIKPNGNYERSILYPNTDWLGGDNYIIDETTVEGKKMADEYTENYPFVGYETDGNRVISILIFEKPVKPEPEEGKKIELVKNDLGEWEYTQVERPLSKTELLEKKMLEQQQIIDAMLGVSE